MREGIVNSLPLHLLPHILVPIGSNKGLMKAGKLLIFLVLFIGNTALATAISSTYYPDIAGTAVLVAITADIQQAPSGQTFPVYFYQDGTGRNPEKVANKYFLLLDSLMRQDLIPDMILVQLNWNYGDAAGYQSIIDTVEANFPAIPHRTARIIGGHSGGAEAAFFSLFNNYDKFATLLYLSHPLLIGPYQQMGFLAMSHLLPNVAAAKAAGVSLVFSHASMENIQTQMGTKHIFDLLHDEHGYTTENELHFVRGEDCPHSPSCVAGKYYQDIFDTIHVRRERMKAGERVPYFLGNTTLADTLRIDFHPVGETPADGFLSDTGTPFSRQGDYYYGWDHRAHMYFKTTAAKLSKERCSMVKLPFGGFRINNENKPLGFQKGSDYFYNPKLLKWELDLANGRYWVRLKGGDPTFILQPEPERASTEVSPNPVSVFEVEGHRAVFHKPAHNYETYTAEVVVEVTDGRLTISNAMDCHWGTIASVEIMPAPSAKVPNAAPHFNINWLQASSIHNGGERYSNDFWITAIRKGSPSEANQRLSFNILGIDSALYAELPKISYTEGNYYAGLTYQAASASMPFADTVVITLQDDGGTTHGGKDCFARIAVIQSGMAVRYVHHIFDCDQIPPLYKPTGGRREEE